MADDLDVPIALRRTRRSNPALRDEASMSTSDDLNVPQPPSCLATASTPTRRTKTKKRVRFSDPGPLIEHVDGLCSTGLTPMVRRTSIRTTPKRRRHSTPARQSNGNGVTQADPFDSAVDSPRSGEVTFLPLRQVLDGRVKRRIRRNGLSEEMNTINAEKRRRAREAKAEIEALRAEVAARDEEIQRLHNETMVMDTERIVELEERIQELRRELALRSGETVRDVNGDASPAFDWTLAARDPFSDELMDMDVDANNDGDDEEDFGETTMAELACSTPTRRRSANTSFPTPPSTSPMHAPMTPSSRVSTPKSHAGVQVVMPDPEKQRMEDELASLQLEICKLTTTLESYSSLTSRLSEKLAPFATEPAPEAQATSTSEENTAIEAHLTSLLQILSDRTAALLNLNNSLSDLGFPGTDASEVITSLSAAFRTARLELEYLTPGEVTLPLTAAGAAVLDLLLTRLRDLSRKSRENDDEIDEYHALELSLRQQLGARVDAMDGLAREVDRLQNESTTKDTRIAELEVGVDRLKGAVRTYARDVSELEGLVQKLEADLETSTAECRKAKREHEADMTEWTAILGEKDGAVSALEAKLSDALAQTAELTSQLAEVQAAQMELKARHRDEIASLSRTQGSALALRDARVAELRGEIDRVNEALRAAHETIRQLRVDSGVLSGRLDEEKRKAKAAIDAVRGELERVVRMSQDFLATPKKGSGVGPLGGGRRSRSGSVEGREGASEGMPVAVVKPGAFLSGDLARRKSDGKGRKRRRYDSGLGFLDEDEVEV